MNVIDHIIKDAEAGIELADRHEQTGHGYNRDATDQDNIFAHEASIEAIDAASSARASCQDAITEGKDEARIAALKKGSEQLRLCELALEKAAGFLKKSEGDQ
ncbi:hypothetical protein [Pararhizobium qamdonense]|uniref:hypothetical protein n=1 Tax=Pararhizobium qamdonense TaxID=3031126 RepID=UPI0023E17B51|nr:hypothetical protein [Pararhizobium qamdonense]